MGELRELYAIGLVNGNEYNCKTFAKKEFLNFQNEFLQGCTLNENQDLIDPNYLKFPPTSSGRQLDEEEEAGPKRPPLGNDHLIYNKKRVKRSQRSLQREGFDFDEYKS